MLKAVEQTHIHVDDSGGQSGTMRSRDELTAARAAIITTIVAAAASTSSSCCCCLLHDQASLSTAGLPAVTAAHTQLAAYTSALQEELTARQAALTALGAETARQVKHVAYPRKLMSEGDE